MRNGRKPNLTKRTGNKLRRTTTAPNMTAEFNISFKVSPPPPSQKRKKKIYERETTGLSQIKHTYELKYLNTTMGKV